MLLSKLILCDNTKFTFFIPLVNQTMSAVPVFITLGFNFVLYQLETQINNKSVFLTFSIFRIKINLLK